MDSRFDVRRTALLLVQRSGCGSLPYLAKQLVESSRTKNHQGAGRHVAGITKLVRHVSRNHDDRTRFACKPFIACLELVNSFENVIELFVSVMHVPRHTLARHHGHLTNAVGAVHLPAGDADCRTALRAGLQRPNEDGCWFRFLRFGFGIQFHECCRCLGGWSMNLNRWLMYCRYLMLVHRKRALKLHGKPLTNKIVAHQISWRVWTPIPKPLPTNP